MAKLYRKKNQEKELLLDQLDLAESFFSRGKGLLGRQALSSQQGLLIKPCNNIHTFFMKFAIDCIFITKNMQIKKIVSNVKPNRIVGPFWKAHSVIETKAGFAEENKLSIGDHLYVVR